MKISVNGEWLDVPIIEVQCQAFAGCCPKPVLTFGEGHECSLPAGHTGNHCCKQCGMEYNSNSVTPWVIQEREEKLRQKELEKIGEDKHG